MSFKIVTTKEIIEKTAKELNLSVDEVKNIYNHFTKTVKTQMGDYDRVYEEIKIPYLGTLTFNKKKHEKTQKFLKDKENKCEN